MANMVHWSSLAIDDALVAFDTHEGTPQEKMLAAMNAAADAQGMNGRRRRHYKRRKLNCDVMPKVEQLAHYRKIVRQELEAYGLTWDMLMYGGQMRIVVDCRWMIIWRVRKETGMSYPAIAKLLDIDHTTAVNAFQKMDQTNGLYYADKPMSKKVMIENRQKLKKIDEQLQEMAA